jgi:hypothetical protein
MTDMEMDKMTGMDDLPRRYRDAATPDRTLDGEAFRALEGKEDDDWSNDFSDEVWHRRDPEDSAAFDPPPHYGGSLDAAFAALRTGMRLAMLGERTRPDAAGDDWRPWCCEIASGLNVFTGHGHLPGCAVMDALLQAETARRR